MSTRSSTTRKIIAYKSVETHGEKILWLFSEQKINSIFKRQSHELNGKTLLTKFFVRPEEG